MLIIILIIIIMQLLTTYFVGTLTQNLMSVANAWCFGAKRTNDEFHEATKAEVSSANHLLGRQSQALTLLQVASLNSRVALERKDENSELKPNGDVRH